MRAAAALQASVSRAEKMLNAFEGALARVERSRAEFPHVDDRELLARKDIVQDLRRRLIAAKGVTNSRRAQAKLDADRRAVRGLCRSPANSALCLCPAPPRLCLCPRCPSSCVGPRRPLPCALLRRPPRRP